MSEPAAGVTPASAVKGDLDVEGLDRMAGTHPASGGRSHLRRLGRGSGAAHASEIQYLMDLPTAAFPGTLSAQQQQLATIMKGYWANFAKRGFPSSSGTPFWPPFNNATQKMQSLAPPTPQTRTDFATTHNCAFWTALESARASR
jgi:carboxylesterase type B